MGEDVGQNREAGFMTCGVEGHPSLQETLKYYKVNFK